MKTHLFLVATLLIAFCSCTTKKSQEEVSVQSLAHEVLMDDECMIGITSELALMNDSMAVVISRKSDNAFQVLNYVDKKTYEVGKIGQGPDEFLLIFGLSVKENGFFFYDANKSRYSTIHLTRTDGSWRVEHLFKTDSLEYVCIQPIRDNKYIASGLYEEHKLVLLDKDGSFLKGFGEIPYQDEDEKKVPGMVRSQVYQGEVAVSPSGKKVVHAIMAGDLIYFYEVSSDGELILKSKKENAYAQYDRQYGALYAESMIHHYDVCATEEYVYTLYSGRNLKEHGEKAFQSNLIRVYDWDGTLVKKLQLDIDIKSMTVAKDNRKIYAIADLPDPVLVVFEL